MSSITHQGFLRIVVGLLALLVSTGCTQLAEDIATHLAAQDVKTFESDFTVFESDLARYRTCLEQRGGSCGGGAATALPHTSTPKPGDAAAHHQPGSSPTLADSVGQLGPGHPAAVAYQMLTHPVVQQASAFHDHLRGHETSSSSGVSTEKGTDADGVPQSTVTMDVRLHHLEDFHTRLLSSIGTEAWAALGDHCKSLVVEHPSDLGLLADCRRAAFVRGYLRAYLRQGEFIEVDVELAGAIREVHQGSQRILRAIQPLRRQLGKVQDQVDRDQRHVLHRLGGEASGISEQVQALVHRVETRVTSRYGRPAEVIFEALSSVTDLLASEAQRMVGQGEEVAANVLRDLVTTIETHLHEVDRELGRLEHLVSDVETRLVNTIDKGLERTDQKLSNVFRVSHVGFVSRDNTFRARLPSIEVVIDPTAKRLFQVRDIDSSGSTTLDSTSSTGESAEGTASPDTAPPPDNPDGAVTPSPPPPPIPPSIPSGQGAPPSPPLEADSLPPTDTGEILTTHSELADLGVAQDRSGVGTGASIGAELARVFFEALFDAHEGLPAVAPVGGVRATGLDLGNHSLPLFSAPMGNVDTRDLNRMTQINDQVGLQTRLVAGRIIAGFGPLNLNNPPLENLFAEVIATTVRKAAAKATWCWFACNLNQDVHRLGAAVHKGVEDKVKEEEQKIRSDLKKDGEKIRTWAHREFEKVKVRLHISG